MKQRKFTVQVQYLVPRWADVVVEATSIEEAAAKAIAMGNDGEIEEWEDDYDSSSAIYAVEAVRGEHDNVIDAPGKHYYIPNAARVPA